MAAPRFWLPFGIASLMLGMVSTHSSFAQVKNKGAEPTKPALSTAKESADEETPADVLKSKNLKRSGTTYVVAGETVFLRKLSAARGQLSQFRQAAEQQRSVEFGLQDRKAFETQMVEQRVLIGQQIAELDRQMPAVDLAQNNSLVNAGRNELVAQHNRLVAMSNAINDRLRLMQNQGNETEIKQQAARDVAHAREAYMQTIIDLRQILDDARKSYDELSKDQEVQAAIKALNDSSKLKVKLGPSKDFLAGVSAFEKTEGSVLTETVEVRKEDGVFWLDVTFNGKVTQAMVFDTGAGLSTLSSALASEIGVKPSPSDPIIKCQTADGSIVEAKQVTVPSMRVGKFTVKNVVCAVMPADKGDVSPLLGQTFHRHFTYKFTPESGSLTMSQVDEGEPGSKNLPAARKGRATSKSRRATRPRAATGFDLPTEENP